MHIHVNQILILNLKKGESQADILAIEDLDVTVKVALMTHIRVVTLVVLPPIKH